MTQSSDRNRSFEQARHPLREAGRERFLADPFGRELKRLVPDPKRILVLGGGDGKEAAALVRIFPRAVVVSMDLSLPELEHGAASPNRAGSFVRGDWDRAPFPNNTFDLAVFFAALHHSEDLPRTLSATHSLLRPSGALYAAHEPMSSLLLGPFQRRRMARIGREEGGIETSPSYRDYLESMKTAGFQGVAIRAASLNLIRLDDPAARFEDAALRRNPWPERVISKVLRVMGGLGEDRKLSFLFWVQRLAFGLYGVTVEGRKG